MGQQVKEIMTGGPSRWTRTRRSPTTARWMSDQGIGDMIVVEGDNAEGIVTDRDIVIRGIAEGAHPNTTRLGQVVSGVVFSALLIYQGSAESKDGTDRIEQAVKRIESRLDEAGIGSSRSS